MRGLRLLLRRAHDQAVELFRHLDLTRQARILPHVVTEIEHVLFHRRWLARLLAPGLIHVAMTCRAGAGAAAFRLDAGNVVAYRRLHHWGAELGVDDPLRSAGIDVRDLRHGWLNSFEGGGG